MKTVQDYLDLGLVFVDGDKICGVTGDLSSNELDIFDGKLCEKKSSKGAVKVGADYYARARWTPSSFAWRNNDGVKPEYNGAMKVELSSGDVIFNCGKTSEFDWRINDNVNPKILRWKPIVISDGIAGRGYRFAINECQKPSFLQYKPKINLIVPDSLKAEVRRVGSEINVTISQKDKQGNVANNLEQVIGIDEVCDAIKQVSTKEDKPMKPVYTAEMHARNELPPIGSMVLVDAEAESGVKYKDHPTTLADVSGELPQLKVMAILTSDVGRRVAVLQNKNNECHCFKLSSVRPISPVTKTIKVNGFDVPAPMSEAPKDGQRYFLASPASRLYFTSSDWNDEDFDQRYMSRCLVHATKSAAIAHAKAMLGINPNPTRSGDGYDRNVLGQNNEGDEI